jgi:peroxiredoxin
LQRTLPEIKALGGQLVAISPQVPDQSLTMVAERGLDFLVLSDIGNRIARDFGLVYTLPEELRQLYVNFGIDLPAANGDASFKLPCPATYVTDRNGNIVLDFVEADHTNRLEPAEVVNVLRKIKVRT